MRNGLDDTLLDVKEGRLVARGDREAARLRDWEEVYPLAGPALEHGNGATQQREAYERTGRLEDVVDMLIEETAQGTGEES